MFQQWPGGGTWPRESPPRNMEVGPTPQTPPTSFGPSVAAGPKQPPPMPTPAEVPQSPYVLPTPPPFVSPPPGIGSGTSPEMNQLMNAMALLLQHTAMQAQNAQNQALPSVGTGSGSGSQETGKTYGWSGDGKLPFGVAIPVAEHKTWKSRVLELQGYRSWFETFLSWLNLLSEHFVHEVRWAVQEGSELKRGVQVREGEQWVRGQRLLTFLQQAFAGYTKVETILSHYVQMCQAGNSNGFEAFRRIHHELALQNRPEALALRMSVMNFAQKGERLTDTVRLVEGEINQYEELIRGGVGGIATPDLYIAEADKVLILQRLLPTHVRMHVQLHGKSDTFQSLKESVISYDMNTRLVQDVQNMRSLVTGESDEVYQTETWIVENTEEVWEIKGGKKGKKGDGRGKGSKGKGKDGKGKGSKGKGKDEKGKGSERRSVSPGLCYNCGKAGHIAKNCPHKRSSSTPSSASRKCFNCGEDGHLAKNCPHPKVRAVENTQSEGQKTSEKAMGLVAVATEASGDQVLSAAEAEGSPPVVVKEFLSRMPEGQVSREMHLSWLVDSGATSHILAKDALPLFQVVRRYEGAKVELFAANRAEITNHGMVDLRVRFRFRVPGSGKHGKRWTEHEETVVMQRVIVADIGFNVMSPFCMMTKGWSCQLSDETRSCLQIEGQELPLKIGDRAWWAYAVPLKKRDRVKERGAEPMDLDVVTSKPPGILKGAGSMATSPKVEVADRPVASFEKVAQSTLLVPTERLGGYTFLMRGLESRVLEEGVARDVVDEVVSGHVRAGRVEVGVPEGDEEYEPDREVPPVKAPEEDPADPDSEGDPELELGPGSAFDHLKKGHQPYLATCLPCARACGRLPARKLKQPAGKTHVGADFMFVGGMRVLVLVVFFTGMLMAVPWSDVDRESSQRKLNQALRELGLTGKFICLSCDGESLVAQSFRAASRLEAFPCTGIEFRVSAPGRSQSNGRAERAIQSVKVSFAANLFSLEEQIQCRVPLESDLAKYALRYACRTFNLFHVSVGSDCSPFDKLRNRRDQQKPRTFPFGCRVLGRLPDGSPQKAELESLTECAYLGPISTNGGGFYGVIAGGSGIGSSGRNQVVKFQVGRIISPVVWRFDDLGWLMNAQVRQEIPRSLPEAVGPFQDPEEEDFGEPALIPKVVQELSSPTKAWLEKHGFTLDCGACKSIQNTGKYHSKKHTIPCRKRYTKWLESQWPKEGESPKPSVPDHPTGGRRVTGKRPHVAVEESDEPMGLEPGGEPSGEAEVEVPEAEGDDAMGVPDGEFGGDAMDVDRLESTIDEIELLLLEMRERAKEMFWYRGLEERVVNGRIWFRVEAFGSSFWESIPEKPACEVSGQAMEPKALKDAVVLELAEMTRLKVGRVVSEGDGREIARKTGTKVLGCRWVYALKSDGRHRARLVTKDFKAAGLSSLKEELYSPTASLEALRTCLAFSETFQLDLLSMDVSVAFMNAPIPEGETQVVQLPGCDNDMRKLLMLLEKALNGLRRAPLYWFKELRKTVIEQLGLRKTSEPTVFAWKGEKSGDLVLLLAYVDDILMFGKMDRLRKMASSLQAAYKVKVTGELEHGKVGKVEFLGREIARETEGGCLTLGLPVGYWDGIEEAAGYAIAAVESPPTLKTVLEVKGEDEDLGVEEAGRFRSVLGKLAWYALTCPPLLWYVSFLSSYQHKPSMLGMKALNMILKFAKTFKGCKQVFGSEGGRLWTDVGPQLLCVVDASWNKKSYIGGIILWGGSMLKVWARKVSVPCLSSCEAELHGIADGVKELLSLGCLMESIWQGGLEGHTFDTGKEWHSWEMLLLTDAESAGHISNQVGLNRRVKHLELRCDLIQWATDTRRLKVTHIAGEENPADILTKPVEVNHLKIFLECIGLDRSSRAWEGVKSVLTSVLAGLGPLSGQNRMRVATGIERGLCALRGPVLELRGGEAPVEVVCEKTVGFLDEVEVREYVDGSFSLPRLWKKRVPVGWHHVLGKWLNSGGVILVEICCVEDSALSRMCQDRGIPYLGFTIHHTIQEYGGALKTVLHSRVSRRCRVAIWISSPCTAGCRLRHINRYRRWRERYQEHVSIWKSIRKLELGALPAETVRIAREWPIGCDLKLDLPYVRCAREIGLLHGAVIRRCCLDGWRKTWEVVCNDAELAGALGTGTCACVNPKVPTITASGEYSLEVARHVVSAFMRCFK